MKHKLNIKLLRKIQRHILEEPRRFFMGWFVARGEPGGKFVCDMPTLDLPDEVPDCGTAGCIAGWANLLTGARPNDVEHALKVLGLVEDRRVFNALEWPDPFRKQYLTAKTSRRRAIIGAARIDHLIKTGR